MTDNPPRQPMRILIVDDDPAAHHMLDALLSFEGYDLHYTSNAHDALAWLRHHTCDLILLDVMMPGMDGFKACEALKSSEATRHIPVILVTALDSKEDLSAGLSVGADDFLPKPVNGLELRARVRSMMRIKRQYDELQDAIRLREELAEMIVHDIRNPLNTIMLTTEVLLMDRQHREVTRNLVQNIRNEVAQVNGYANDMLQLIRMESGRLSVRRSAVQLGNLARTAQRSHAMLAETRHITVALDLPSDEKPVMADASLMQGVVNNLLSNAIKFAPRDSTVTIRVSQPDGLAGCIEVIDEGPGVPAADRERIFGKFETVAMPNLDAPQIGLGLNFAKHVTDAHNGRIFVTSNPPQGARFVIELP